ncbi:MAG: hypothetical protein UX91_C0015G0012 [Candidatus Amesbacteria bacterium GW2011_GWB1_47_19]|nr:MAG: hypothetical protein UX91_C0015G0012 [Candidatus Amesbacteria bacterium GW2011_GWB1_47_19]
MVSDNTLIKVTDMFFKWLIKYGKCKNITEPKNMGETISKSLIKKGEIKHDDDYRPGRTFKITKNVSVDDTVVSFVVIASVKQLFKWEQ